MMWGYGYGTPGAGMTTWMILSSVLWLVLVGIAVWAFVRWLSTRSPSAQTATPVDALELLRQRYARGEIDEATFDRMQAHLTAAPNQARQAVTASDRVPSPWRSGPVTD